MKDTDKKERAVKYKWGMVIDLDRCTGCGACVVACHAENNVPFVGKELSGYGRAMHWIRIERYWEGEYPHVRARFIPVLCQQCNNAPCEPVCPVYASYHNAEGLNAQVYNRCVGTRYCANNCPYSVRVFNFFEPSFPEPLDQQLSPDVTVRTKGVMEKCTFCIQRIRRAKETARLDGRAVRDGEIQPACAQTCPPDAIIFGNLADPKSRVFRFSKSPRRFRLIEDLGTDPSVIYLKGGGHEHVR
ncbi:MAG: 4Fe-4S dicluster domain-containing protein [bacterium]